MTAVSLVQVRALQQQQLEDLLGLLQGVGPFADLGREKLISLAIFVRPVGVPKDHTIVKQGDPVDGLYIIRQGRCLLSTQLPGTQSSNIMAHSMRVAVYTGDQSSTVCFAKECWAVLWCAVISYAVLHCPMPGNLYTIISRALRWRRP